MPVKEVQHLGVIGPIRCPCGQVIAHAANRYDELRKQGQSMKHALDNCGLSTQGPIIAGAPASECCRAYIMCSIDLTTNTHQLYQEVVQYNEMHLTKATMNTTEEKG